MPPVSEKTTFGRLRRAWSLLAPWKKWALAVLLLAILAVRLYGLGTESFWVDETLSARIAEGPFSQILNSIPRDKPPLDYYLQALAHPLAVPEISHRIPAVISGLFAIFGILFWAWVWFGRRVAVLAWILAAFNFMILYFSRDARPYALLMALSAWQQGVFVLWWRRRSALPPFGRPARLLLFVLFVFSLLLVFTMYSALIVFAGQALFLLIAPFLKKRFHLSGMSVDATPPVVRIVPHEEATPPPTGSAARRFPPASRRERLRLLLPYLAVITCALIPAILLLWNRSQLRPPADQFWRFEGFDLLHIGYVFAAPLLPTVLITPTLAIALLSILLLVFGMKRAWKFSPPASLNLLLGVIIPLATLPILYAVIDRIYIPKYAAFTQPGCCILYALGFQTIGRETFARVESPFLRRRLTGSRLALAFILVLALYSVFIFEWKAPFRPDWRGAAETIASQARIGDRVIVPGDQAEICIEYYLRRFFKGPLPVYTQVASLTQPQPSGRTWMVYHRFPKGEERSVSGTVSVSLVDTKPPDNEASSLAYELGTPPTFRLADGPTQLLGEGWSLPETWSPAMKIRWVVNLRATIFFPLARAAAGHLSIALYPHSYEGAPPQTVTAVVNGHGLDTRGVPFWKQSVVDWEVPSDFVHPGFNDVTFKFAHIRSPSTLRKNYADFRSLAAAVQFVRWQEDAAAAGEGARRTNPGIFSRP